MSDNKIKRHLNLELAKISKYVLDLYYRLDTNY